jgi:hypothetical protein
MKPALPLRIASILALVAALGHTLLFLNYHPTHGPDEIVVVTAMQTHVFSFGGFLHSYWQLYFGYELFVTISCLVECAILWQLANLSTTLAIRPIILVLFLGEVATSVLMFKFFFILPIVVHTATALCLLLALLTLKPQTSPAASNYK